MKFITFLKQPHLQKQTDFGLEKVFIPFFSVFTFGDRFATGGIRMRQIFSKLGCEPGKAHPWRGRAGAGGHGKQGGY